jgi:hypothetical protein
VTPEAASAGPAVQVQAETRQLVADPSDASADALHSGDDVLLADGIPLEHAAGAALGSGIEQSDDCGGYVSIAASPRSGGTLSIPNASKGQSPALVDSGGDSRASARITMVAPTVIWHIARNEDFSTDLPLQMRR